MRAQLAPTFDLAYAAGLERLVAVIEGACERDSTAAQRIEAALRASLELLAHEPDLARLLTVEPLADGEAAARRHHDWLMHCATLLHNAREGYGDHPRSSRLTEWGMVNAIASRIAKRVLSGETHRLPELLPELLICAGAP